MWAWNGILENYKPWSAYEAVCLEGKYQAGATYKHWVKTAEEAELLPSFKQTFDGTVEACGISDFEIGKIGQSVFEHRIWHPDYTFGDAYKKVNQNKIFGEKPWRDQHAAEDTFKVIAGYEIDAGFSAWIKQGKEDFETIKKGFNVVITVGSGIIEGVLLTPVAMCADMGVGVVGGFNKGGLPGLSSMGPTVFGAG